VGRDARRRRQLGGFGESSGAISGPCGQGPLMDKAVLCASALMSLMLLVEDGVVCIRTTRLIPGIKKLDECHVFYYAAGRWECIPTGSGALL